jgi:hypothetical protein
VDVASDFDRMVTGDSTSILGQQHNPSIAVNPLDDNLLVAVAENTHSITGNPQDCTMYLSLDGGDSYFYFFDLPITAANSCGSPRVAYSPDGVALYVAYLEYTSGPLIGSPTAPLTRFQAYNGFSLAGPTSSLTIAGGVFDSPTLGVHAYGGPGAQNVYLGFTYFSGSSCTVYLDALSSYGTVSSLIPLGTSSACTGGAPLTERLVQGPSIVGGPANQVLACWFDSGVDGYSTPVQTSPPAPPTPVAPLNKFNIACRSSNNLGVTFAGNVLPPESVNPPDYTRWIYAAKGVSSELPYWLGPNGLWFYTGASQYPSLAIDHLGNAHVVFSFNPSPGNRFKSEAANVAYVKSIDPVPTTLLPTIYSKWSGKSVVGTGAGGQLFPVVATQHVHESSKPYVYVGWLDTSASMKLGAANANTIYDARYRLSTSGGPAFGKTIVASDHASTTDFVSVGNYLGATANPGIFHFVWTDNRYSFSNYAAKEHIFADRN